MSLVEWVTKNSCFLKLLRYLLWFWIKSLAIEYKIWGFKYLLLKKNLVFEFNDKENSWCSGHSTSINACGVWRIKDQDLNL